MPEKKLATSGDTGRDEKGRLLKGHKALPGGGNPNINRLAEYNKKLTDAILEVGTPENLKRFITSVLIQAQGRQMKDAKGNLFFADGDMAAANIVMKIFRLEKIQVELSGEVVSIVGNLTDDEKKNLLLKIEERNGFKPSEK